MDDAYNPCSRRRGRAVARLGAVSAALLIASGACCAQAQTSAVPSPAEIEFWRSTERIGTPDAYRAYLAAFPNGLYVPLARAALGSGGSAVPAAGTPPTAPPSTTAQPARTLRYFSESPNDTGAIDYRIGDRFSGPGPLTLGRLGSRRQIVLPEGDWVALAGTDWRGVIPNNQTPAGFQVSMATVVFGKFAGDRLVTMLRYTANARQPPTLAGNSVQLIWPDFDRCDPATNTRLMLERKTPDAFREECTSMWVAPDPLAEPWPGNAEAKQNIARIGASVRGAAIVTTLTFAERRYGYLGVVRIDWPSVDPGAEQAGAWQPDEISRVPARRAFVKSLSDWAAAYRKVALDGYRNDYPASDLTPVATFK